jgi:hypothetical protein
MGALAGAAALAAAVEPAAAITAGNGPGASESTAYQQTFLGAPAYFVESGDDIDAGVDVTFDPQAGPWIKTFAGPDSTTAPLNVSEGFEAIVFEFIRVDGDTPWTEWHEEIQTDGWVWSDSVLGLPFGPDIVFLTAPPTNVPIPGLQVTRNGGDLGFTFDPLPVGSEIVIFKVMQFVGFSDQVPEETFAGFVEVHEYPVGEVSTTAVPEPMTAGLGAMALAAAGAAVTRRRVR